MNATDRNNCNSANYLTTIRSNSYYLRTFCWGLDCAIHCEYVIVCWLVSRGLGYKKWRCYLRPRDWRKKFQIDLAINLINYAIGLDWDGGDDHPSYMRTDSFVPCNCKKMYLLYWWAHGCHLRCWLEEAKVGDALQVRRAQGRGRLHDWMCPVGHRLSEV